MTVLGPLRSGQAGDRLVRIRTISACKASVSKGLPSNASKPASIARTRSLPRDPRHRDQRDVACPRVFAQPVREPIPILAGHGNIGHDCVELPRPGDATTCNSASCFTNASPMPSPRLVRRQFDPQGATRRRELDRVGHEIPDDLLQPHDIAEDPCGLDLQLQSLILRSQIDRQRPALGLRAGHMRRSPTYRNENAASGARVVLEEPLLERSRIELGSVRVADHELRRAERLGRCVDERDRGHEDRQGG